MTDRLVKEYSITKEWVEKSLQQYHQTKSLPTISEIHVLGDSVLGYMSAIVRVHIKWAPEESATLPPTVIAKIPNPHTAEEAWKKFEHEEENLEGKFEENQINKLMHENEVKSYTIFQETTHSMKIPKLYGYQSYASGSPVLLLEDIADSITVDLVEGFNEQQVYAIMDEQIALHKWSKTTDKWRDLFKTNDNMCELNQQFCKTILVMHQQLKQEHPELTDCLDILVRNYMHDINWFSASLKEAQEDPQSVFNHGDLWAPQILWQGNTITGIVDWALCHAGNWTGDILRILSTCCTSEMRRKLEKPLLAYYAEKMNLSFEDVLKNYYKTLPQVCAMTTFAVAMWANSPVLRRGKPDDEARVKEMNKRLKDVIEDTAKYFNWI